ncbi:glutathione S-transferase family protein [Sphingomonas sp. HITSZ_GF]|uniref:glutathione S-transferase family protein n=1 Tax=Sphingomonas sp. HITSZ_GF TaxID=3037247 RepID=UPI00240E3639|nr:glutathione S-transferase family protein [Sphingomonas sp. HITSZ_GF]MDG2534987.1 glutathione S-transferase family protein [Sphingomonas sp. HITSZ_GF]
MADDLIFYTHPQSRGRIARWALEEAGAAYETQLVDYGTTMKGGDYLSVNPMGKVPAIVHNGHVVTECAAICAYLAEAFPEAGLAPTADERADYYRWLFFAAGPVEQAVTNNHAQFVPSPEQGRMFGYGSYDATVDVLEKAVSAHPYIAGDRFTAADIYVGSAVGWGTMFGTLPKRQAFLDYFARLSSREAYQRAGAKDDALAAELEAAKTPA